MARAGGFDGRMMGSRGWWSGSNDLGVNGVDGVDLRVLVAGG